MKNLLAFFAMPVAVAMSGQALAHGEAARHGGIVRESSNGVSLELVNKDGTATIYVDDHGKPVPTEGASGKLTVLNGAQKTELPLESAGANMLVARGDAKLGAGAKAIAAVTLADKKTVSVRFAIK